MIGHSTAVELRDAELERQAIRRAVDDANDLLPPDLAEMMRGRQ